MSAPTIFDNHEEWWSWRHAHAALETQARVDAPNEIDRSWLVRTAISNWNDALKYGRLECC